MQSLKTCFSRIIVLTINQMQELQPVLVKSRSGMSQCVVILSSVISFLPIRVILYSMTGTFHGLPTSGPLNNKKPWVTTQGSCIACSVCSLFTLDGTHYIEGITNKHVPPFLALTNLETEFVQMPCPKVSTPAPLGSTWVSGCLGILAPGCLGAWVPGHLEQEHLGA